MFTLLNISMISIYLCLNTSLAHEAAPFKNGKREIAVVLRFQGRTNVGYYSSSVKALSFKEAASDGKSFDDTLSVTA